MFENASRTTGQFFLRLYSWKSGAITIGRNQNEQIAFNAKKLNGTPVIRRITGGRALYHDSSELTYSIAGNCAGNHIGAIGNSVFQSNRVISEALLHFLKVLEIKAHYVRQSSPNFLSTGSFHTLPCFESRARHEIVGEQGKLAASAQRRIGEVFLQHGSIKINGIAGHPALISSVTNSLDSSNIQSLENSRFEEISPVFCESIGTSLGIDFVPAEFNEADLIEISAFEESVKKNSLGQRDLIKQNRQPASLSGEMHN
ncbi:MAG TPA: hypothetical protein VHP63_00945 [candidate division Zixibacteria bacterium]|nr:hypothetical protein [candidate division Zixibacteria bacterium]